MVQDRRPATVVLTFAAVLLGVILAGCTTSAPESTGRGDDGADSSRFSLSPRGSVVTVSEPGHRMTEFMVAANPVDDDHLVLSAMDLDDDSGAVACRNFVSYDGGDTWRLSEPAPGLDVPKARFDPWVAIDSGGVVHHTCLMLQESQVLWYAASPDGGATWSKAVPTALSPSGGADKEAISVVSNDTLVLCGAAGGLRVIMSHDGGASWSDSKHIGDGGCNGVLEGPDGDLHMLYHAHVSDGFEGLLETGLVSSSDGGLTWDNPVRVSLYRQSDEIVNPESWVGTFAVNPMSGNIMVATQEWHDEQEQYRIHLWRSGDGSNFTALTTPSMASDSCAGCHETMPVPTADSEGRIGLQYTLTNPGGTHREVWFTATEDDGLSWMTAVQLSKTDGLESYLDPRAWTPADASPVSGAVEAASDGPDGVSDFALAQSSTALRNDWIRWGGDYWGTVATDDGFQAFWIDFSENGVTQIYTQTVGVESAAVENY